MPTRSWARVLGLVAAASVAAGCSGEAGVPAVIGLASASAASEAAPSASAAGPAVVPLQLRLVTSSTDGPCSAPALTGAGAGDACDAAGSTTYTLGESLGELTATSATVAADDAQSTGRVLITLDATGSATLRDATAAAVGQRLAMLADGKVLSAPTVGAVVTGDQLVITGATRAAADQIAATLLAPATP